MNDPIESAVRLTGQKYLDAEKALRDTPNSAPMLKGKSRDPDWLARLIAQVVLNWNGARAEDYQGALNYLNWLPTKVAKTPVGTPDPSGVAAYLKKHFGDRVADLLALRLVKQSDWPSWQVLGVLLYLQEARLPETTSPLIRFASLTENAEWRDFAIKAIREIKDPDLPAKVAYERRWFEQQGKTFPAALSAL